ncbi:unnamed protein product [Coregonus sp. 'balchen']|nr:unnamed protein product [Coregonus sp. 'balchen']
MGCESKAAFLNALRGVGPEDEGAALPLSPTPPEDLAIYPTPNTQTSACVTCHPSQQPCPLTPHSVVVILEALSVQRDIVYLALLAFEMDTEKSLEERREASLEARKAKGVALPTVFRRGWAVASLFGGMSAIPVPLVALYGGHQRGYVEKPSVAHLW